MSELLTTNALKKAIENHKIEGRNGMALYHNKNGMLTGYYYRYGKFKESTQ